MTDSVTHLLTPLKKTLLNKDNNAFLQEGKVKVTLKEVYIKVCSLCYSLKKLGVQPGDRVAVYLNRGINATITIYSILSIGGVYVPLNINDAPLRLSYVLENTGVMVIVGEGTPPTWLSNFIWHDITYFSQLNNYNLSLSNNKQTLAAILYSSGSTGEPKLVALSHKAMITFSDWAGFTFNIKQGTLIASLAPITFDLSIFDLFTSLRFNSSVVFIPQSLVSTPLLISGWIIKHKVNIWYTVPSVLSFWTDKGNIIPKDLTSLTTIMFAGEIFPARTLYKLVNLLPTVKFYNLYGPVECNVCTYWRVNLKRVNTIKPIPIGNAACNAELKINKKNNELLVKGPALMLGYWKNHNIVRHKGWYKTGDKVEVNEYGEYLYKGRIDRKFKYFGFLIDPLEIELKIMSLVEINECAVLLLKLTEHKFVTACISTNKFITDKNITNYLRSLLPSYMTPTLYIRFSQLPRLLNGKINFKAIEHTAISVLKKKYSKKNNNYTTGKIGYYN